jgi:hypothetical protein
MHGTNIKFKKFIGYYVNLPFVPCVDTIGSSLCFQSRILQLHTVELLVVIVVVTFVGCCGFSSETSFNQVYLIAIIA